MTDLPSGWSEAPLSTAADIRVSNVDKHVRPEFAAAGGAVGGYNLGWLDPGPQVMRVHGEPRTSLLTTPNGQFPARKAGGGGGNQQVGGLDLTVMK